MTDDETTTGETSVDEPYSITGQMGELYVDVEGEDPTWVQRQFDRVWAERLAEASEMSDEEREQLGLYQ